MNLKIARLESKNSDEGKAKSATVVFVGISMATAKTWPTFRCSV